MGRLAQNRIKQATLKYENPGLDQGFYILQAFKLKSCLVDGRLLFFIGLDILHKDPMIMLGFTGYWFHEAGLCIRIDRTNMNFFSILLQLCLYRCSPVHILFISL
jgi:hypothetical protein